MPTYKGNNGHELQREDLSHAYGQGSYGTIEYVGTHDAIVGQFSSLIEEGWEFDARAEQPYYRLTASRQGILDDNANDYYDRFSITKETIEKDIWTLDRIFKEVNGPSPPEILSGYSGDFDAMKETVETAISEGDESFISGLEENYPETWGIYYELTRGAEAYEEEYTVLTRERVVPYPSGRKLTLPQFNTSKIYQTHDALKNAFDITDDNLVGITLPAKPDNNDPTNTKWGWRNRRREVVFMEGQKIQLVEDWAWAAWSTNIYNTA